MLGAKRRGIGHGADAGNPGVEFAQINLMVIKINQIIDFKITPIATFIERIAQFFGQLAGCFPGFSGKAVLIQFITTPPALIGGQCFKTNQF